MQEVSVFRTTCILHNVAKLAGDGGEWMDEAAARLPAPVAPDVHEQEEEEEEEARAP